MPRDTTLRYANNCSGSILIVRRRLMLLREGSLLKKSPRASCRGSECRWVYSRSLWVPLTLSYLHYLSFTSFTLLVSQFLKGRQAAQPEAPATGGGRREEGEAEGKSPLSDRLTRKCLMSLYITQALMPAREAVAPLLKARRTNEHTCLLGVISKTPTHM